MAFITTFSIFLIFNFRNKTMHRSLIIQTQEVDYTPKHYKSFELERKQCQEPSGLISYPKKTKILQSFTYEKNLKNLLSQLRSKNYFQL